MRFAKGTLSAAALFALAAFTLPASAQTQAASGDSGGNNSLLGIGIGEGGAVDPAVLEKRREIEEAYQKATKTQPATKTTAVNDPWANMRGNEPPKVAT